MSSHYAPPAPRAGTYDSSQNPGNAQSSATPFMERTFPCGSLFGIPIKIHVLFPIYMLITALYGFSGGDPEYGAMQLLLNGPVLFGTVLVHELGHCFATWHVGGQVHQILLWPLGGLAYVGHDGDAGDDLKVSIAGPLTHIPQALVWVILLALSADGEVSLTLERDAFFANLCREAIVINVALFAFNLCVPAYPLDGGRIFCASLLLCGVGVSTAATVTVYVSGALALLIVALGVYLYNVMSIFVGAWVGAKAYELHRVNQQGRLDLHPVFNKYCDGGGAAGGGGRGGNAQPRSADAGAGGIAGALGGSGRV
jgi:Zn-dependent protease